MTKKIIEIDASNALRNIHQIVGGNTVVITTNPNPCLACGFNGLDPKCAPTFGGDTGSLP